MYRIYLVYRYILSFALQGLLIMLLYVIWVSPGLSLSKSHGFRVWIDDTGLSSNHQSLHAVVVMVKHNSLLFAILSSKVLDTRRVVLLSIPTYLLRSYSFGRIRLIPLVKEHYKATQMLPEAILHHYRPPTSSTHNTLIHQNAGKTYLPTFNSDAVGSPSTLQCQ